MPWLFGALPLAFWSFIALLHWAQISVAMHTHGHVWWRLLAWTWVLWGTWGFLTPLVLRAARRFRLERPVRLRHVALHCAAAVGIALVHLLPAAAVMVWLEPYAPRVEVPSFGRQYVQLALDCLHVDFLIYWAVLGAGYAYEYRERLRDRELRAAELSAQLARAQLEALQLQIHPHFLFNALHSVAALVRKNETQAAVSMLDGLGELLRYVLDSAGTPVVSLERELAFIARYLEIQQVRFSDRLTGRLDAPVELLDAQVPTLILQPLVENAIEHGIARVGSAGLLEIEARADAHGLRICVRDNGPGLGDRRRQGIGLANTKARLRKLYGTAADVVLEESGSGSVVSLTLPLVHAS